MRGLERDLGVSSNTVRLELNKLSDMQLIQEHTATINTKTKHYTVNIKHPMFKSLRGVILQHVGLDQIIENVLDKLGNVDEVYLTGDLALGKNSPFVDLVLVGDIDKAYLYNLIEKAEILINKKNILLFAVYPTPANSQCAKRNEIAGQGLEIHPIRYTSCATCNFQ